ncbi:MAG: hypothetical protein QOG23_399 [Blastocatellia bacterium]|jgi:hypothetical protein|nr:hypothetical protein [Blastocatellia bacterium]
MRRILLICSAVILFAASASAQKTKPWTEWTPKDAQKVLTDSPWSQSQTEVSDAPSSSGSAITKTESRNEAQMVGMDLTKQDSKNQESGENIGRRNTGASLSYRISLLSAKPIRQAFIRLIELQRPEMSAEKVAEIRTFVDRDFGDYVVVTVNLDGTDKKRLVPAMQEINTADASVLKTTTYLERRDGKRVALMDYRAPTQDGMGAKFVFPRMLDGKPFLDVNSGEMRVYIELGKTIKLNRRFKVADMVYDGKLEF